MGLRLCVYNKLIDLRLLTTMPYLKKDPPCPEPLDCRILTAALNLFVENGFHNVSIHQVQKEADVSIGSIYNHFGGKEGVAKALYQHILNEIDELIDAVLISVESPREQCEEIIKQLFEHTETHPNIIAFMFHTTHREFLPNEPLVCDGAAFIKLRQVIEKGIKQDQFVKQDVWIISASVFGSAFKMIQLRLDNSLEKPLPELYDAFIHTTMNGIASEEKTR